MTGWGGGWSWRGSWFVGEVLRLRERGWVTGGASSRRRMVCWFVWVWVWFCC